MRKIVIAICAIALLLVGAGVIATASIPGADGVVYGCYKTSNPATGAVIVIDSEASCPSGYTSLNWNQTGPEGPAGESSFQRVFETETLVETDTYITVPCPTGMQAVNGGFWELSPEQAWLDAVANDPNPPGGVQIPQVSVLDESTRSQPPIYPVRAPNGVSADGMSWTVGLSLQPFAVYDGQFYDTDATVWAGCV